MSSPWYSERIYQKDSPTFLIFEILSSPLSEFRSPQYTVILHIQPLMRVSCEETLRRHPWPLTQQELVLSEDRLMTCYLGQFGYRLHDHEFPYARKGRQSWKFCLKLGYMSILTFEPTLGPNLLSSPVLCKASRSIDIGSLAFQLLRPRTGNSYTTCEMGYVHGSLQDKTVLF